MDEIKLPPFKADLKPIGKSSKALIIPAKMREDHGIKDDQTYWWEVTARETE